MRVFALLSLAALAQATVLPAAVEDTVQDLKAEAPKVPSLPHVPKIPAIVPRDCTPGTYQCWTGVGSSKETESEVQVCTTAGVWVMSAICGSPTCCSESDGKAWCKC